MPSTSASPWFLRPWGTNLLLLALSLAFLLPATGLLPLMDRDEPKFAQATVEMIERDDWIIPWLNNEYRFDKPPLTYWWMRLHVSLIGPGELASRLHSVLAAALTAMVVAALGRWLFSARAGLLAGLAWVSCLQVLVHVGRLCVADMPMILGLAVAQWAAARLVLDKEVPSRGSPPRLWIRAVVGALFLGAALLLWRMNLGFSLLVARCCFAEAPAMGHSIAAAAAGFVLGWFFLPSRRPGLWWWILLGGHIFAFLAKGPIALAVSALGLLFTRWVFGRRHAWPWWRLHPGTFLPLFLVGIGIWGIPAIGLTEGAFFDVGIGEHVIERGTTAFNGRVPLPGFYFFTLFLSLIPWAGLVPAALRPSARPIPPAEAWLLGWLAAPYLIFSLYSTMLPHYVAPGFAAFFLLLTRHGGLPSPGSTFASIWAGFAAFVPLVAATILLFAGVRLPFSGETAILGTLILLVAAMALACGLATLAANRGRLIAALLFMLATVPAFHAAAGIIRQTHPATRVGEIAAGLPASTRFRAVAFTEPSLVYHTRAGWEMKSAKQIAKTAEWLRNGSAKKPRVAIFLLREWSAADALEHRFKTGAWKNLPPDRNHATEVALALRGFEGETHRVTGYNNGRTSWVELLVAVQPPPGRPPRPPGPP